MAKLSEWPKLFAAQNWGRAEKLLRKAASDRRAPPEVFLNLGKVLEAQGKRAQALTCYKRALGARAGWFEALFDYGRALMDEGDLAAARPLLEKAQAARPDDPYVRRNLGRIALRTGDRAAVAAAYDGVEDEEGRMERYRATVERGGDGTDLLSGMLADPAQRPAALRVMVRTTKGRIPRRV